MLSKLGDSCKIYIVCGYTDLRQGIDGLAGTIQQQFQIDPFNGSVFLFCGRRSDRIKALLWEENGFVLMYKRMEKGGFRWPRGERSIREITAQQYRWLLDGLKIDQPRSNAVITGLSIV